MNSQWIRRQSTISFLGLGEVVVVRDDDDDDDDGVIYVIDVYVLPQKTCWKLIWIVIIRIYSDSILTYKTETSFNIILMLLPYQTLNIIYIPSSVQFQSVPAAVAATLVWDF